MSLCFATLIAPPLVVYFAGPGHITEKTANGKAIKSSAGQLSEWRNGPPMARQQLTLSIKTMKTDSSRLS